MNQVNVFIDNKKQLTIKCKLEQSLSGIRKILNNKNESKLNNVNDLVFQIKDCSINRGSENDFKLFEIIKNNENIFNCK